MSCVCSPSLCRSKLLPPGLVSAVRDGPGEAAVAALAQSSETPERVWNRSMQRAAAEEVAHLAAVARAHQASAVGRQVGCVGALASAVEGGVICCCTVPRQNAQGRALAVAYSS